MPSPGGMPIWKMTMSSPSGPKWAGRESMDAFREAHEKWNAMPWVNTISTSADGQAVYFDNSTVGNLSAGTIAEWQTASQSDPLVRQAYGARGLLVLDGSKKQNDFVDGGAPVPGTVPFSERPLIARSDYVFNSNDSYWLSSPREPRTGHSPLYGPVGTERSRRTRMNIVHLEDDAARGEDGKWSLDEVQGTILSNRSLAAHLFKSELVAACEESASEVMGPACEVLKAYNGHLDLDSPGAVLFRQWLEIHRSLSRKARSPEYSTAFSPEDPVGTPSGLQDKARALQALEAAVAKLTENGLGLDANLSEVQLAWRGDRLVAVHGGHGLEGVANLIHTGSRNDTFGPRPDGSAYGEARQEPGLRYQVNAGTSFIMTLEFGADGPRAEAFLTYGQSGVPMSEHFHDQTELFSKKEWRKIRFSKEDVEAGLVERMTVSGN